MRKAIKEILQDTDPEFRENFTLVYKEMIGSLKGLGDKRVVEVVSQTMIVAAKAKLAPPGNKLF